MPVDKFGGNAGTAAAGTAAQFSTAGLVHKTGDNMLGILSMGGFRLTNVGAPTASGDAATKRYADTIDQDNLQLSGGTMTGELNMGGQLVRGLPTDYPPYYSGDEALSWSQTLRLINDFTTNNTIFPEGPLYLTNKQYVDGQDSQALLKSDLKTVSGTIPSATYTDHNLFTFPPGKSISNGKIRITELWVERGAGNWCAASCARFNSHWSQFHLFSRGTSFLVKFASIRGSWTRNYRLDYIELP
jgi:hypothetical protein